MAKEDKKVTINRARTRVKDEGGRTSDEGYKSAVEPSKDSLINAVPPVPVEPGGLMQLLNWVVLYWDKVLIMLALGGAVGSFAVFKGDLSRAAQDIDRNLGKIQSIENDSSLSRERLVRLEEVMSYTGKRVDSLEVKVEKSDAELARLSKAQAIMDDRSSRMSQQP